MTVVFWRGLSCRRRLLTDSRIECGVGRRLWLFGLRGCFCGFLEALVVPVSTHWFDAMNMCCGEAGSDVVSEYALVVAAATH